MSNRKSNSAWKTPKSANTLKRSALNAIHGRTPNQIADSLRSNGDPVLSMSDWRTLKKKVHDTYGYRCMRCGITPKDRRHCNVDHIKPRLYFPELALEFNNLQVLCGRCNKAKGNGYAVDYRPKPCDAEGEFSDHNLSKFLRCL